MVVVSTNGRQDTEESIVLGMDFSSNDRYGTTEGRMRKPLFKQPTPVTFWVITKTPYAVLL